VDVVQGVAVSAHLGNKLVQHLLTTPVSIRRTPNPRTHGRYLRRDDHCSNIAGLHAQVVKDLEENVGCAAVVMTDRGRELVTAEGNSVKVGLMYTCPERRCKGYVKDTVQGEGV
jgi:hypothetical protein